MKELFRTNLYIADSDSVNMEYLQNDYIQRFKSGLLMAKTVGMNPNMIFDSLGFEAVINNKTIEAFFIKKSNQLQKEGKAYYLNLHIFNNYVEDNFFDYCAHENPFLRYYHDKIDTNYYFSSYQLDKKSIERDHIIRHKLYSRLDNIYQFHKRIYKETGSNIFKVHDSETVNLREAIINRIDHSYKNAKNFDYEKLESKEIYLKLLATFLHLINENKNITNRSNFYGLLQNKHLLDQFSQEQCKYLKEDIIDVTYNSSFIKKGEIFRYKSVNHIDKINEKLFNSYVHEGKIYKLYEYYKVFDKAKSRFELLELIGNPVKIVDYVVDELMNSVEEKGISTLHNLASFILPKTRLMGVAESENILIGVK